MQRKRDAVARPLDPFLLMHLLKRLPLSLINSASKFTLSLLLRRTYHCYYYRLQMLSTNTTDAVTVCGIFDNSFFFSVVEPPYRQKTRRQCSKGRKRTTWPCQNFNLTCFNLSSTKLRRKTHLSFFVLFTSKRHSYNIQ